MGGTTTPFHYEFGAKGQYGAPRDVDGHVPQVYATWVNGLTPGRYYVRAWVFRYVQSALDGSTFQEYYFDVTPKEWAGDVTVPLDLRLSSWVNKTVHFHDNAGLINEDNVSTGAVYLFGMLKDEASDIWAHNVTDMADQVDNNGNILHMWIGLYGINATWSGRELRHTFRHLHAVCLRSGIFAANLREGFCNPQRNPIVHQRPPLPRCRIQRDSLQH